MIDIARQINAINRQVAIATVQGTESVVVTAERQYPSEINDVWSALTDPERIRRWFMPISGDLTEGGQFQLEGNASGDILTCQPPKFLSVTFGAPESVVEVRLSAAGEETLLTLEHRVPLAMAGSGAGAFYVGPGWDGALLALALYSDGIVAEDPVAAASTPEAQQFCARSVDAWQSVVEASGTADQDAIAAGREVALAQFSPDLVGG